MRMWMIEPRLLCRNHLLGEHFEIHCAVGNLHKDGKWATYLTKQGYLEPQNFKQRHDEIVIEMKQRGYNHKSPLEVDVGFLVGHVDRRISMRDLKNRCERCLVDKG